MKRYKEYEIDVDNMEGLDIGEYLTKYFQNKRIINIVPEFDISGWGINNYYIYTEENDKDEKI